MKLLITGGLGFVGRQLSAQLLTAGHHVTALGRNPNPVLIPNENFNYIAADTTREGDWQESVVGFDAVINLAGQSIFRRWNDRNKQLMYDSRVLTTRYLVAAIPADKKMVFLSTSAVGYYGNRQDDILVESEPGSDDFLGVLARDWEAEALKAEKKGARVAIMRFGIVLGNGGGALGMMQPAFKLFLGGPLGKGAQWFPWIHMADLVSAIQFLLENESCSGPFNFCAPEPVRNRDLAATLGRALTRPSLLPVPAFMVRFILGELGDVLMASSRAIPEKLRQGGFSFRFPDVASALLDLVNR
jgi:uncharacterized protein